MGRRRDELLERAGAYVASYEERLSALIAEGAIEYMEAPVARVAGFDTPFPNTLEHHYLPDPRRVLDAIERTHAF